MQALLKRVLAELEDGIGTIIVAAAFSVMLAGVLFRYVFNDSLTWSEEFARYALVMITFLGIGTGFRKASHIKIDAISNRFPKGAIYFELLGLAASIAFMGFLLVQALALSRVLGASRSAAMGMPMTWLYFGVAFALLIGLVRAVIALFVSLRSLRR
jgi:TRAP-type C4-dicarboxylate transport system permease small subunit